MKKKLRIGLIFVIVLIMQFSIVALAEETSSEALEETSSETLEETSGETTEETTEEPLEKTDDVLHYGWYQEDGAWYYGGSDGHSINGWHFINGAWYYFDAENENVMLQDTKMLIDGDTYFFDSNGAMETGWIKRAEGWYYTNYGGQMVTGWKQIGNDWYYLDGNNSEYPGLMCENEKKQIDGKFYFFDSNGAMETGWVLKNEGWYYIKSSGAMFLGWLKSGDAWYYLDPDNEEYLGLMVANETRTIGDLEYRFKESGVMYAGWQKSENGDWTYYDEYSGQLITGWKWIGSAWYYLDPDNQGIMRRNGWMLINNDWYYFRSSGSMVSEWLFVNSNWYYLGSDGAMREDWQKIDGDWYYFYTENDSHGGSYGAMARNTEIDGYKISGSGAMITRKQLEMEAKAQGYSSSTDYLILVDLDACKVAIFEENAGNWETIKFWDCAPGAPSTPTVTGVFTVKAKGYYFDSGSDRCFYYTQFWGDYLFHSVLYSKYDGSVTDGRVGMHISHGCVRLKIENAEWIYDNIPSGTKVVIY